MSTDVEMGNISQKEGTNNSNDVDSGVKEPFEGVPLEEITMEYCMQHKEDCQALIDAGLDLDRLGFAPIRVTFFYRHDLVLFLPFTSVLVYNLNLVSTCEWIFCGWLLVLGLVSTVCLDIFMLMIHLLLVPFRLLALPFCREEKAVDVLLWSLFMLKYRPVQGIRSVRGHLAFLRAHGREKFYEYSYIRYLDRWLPVDMEDMLEDLSETVPEVKVLLYEPGPDIVATSMYNASTHTVSYGYTEKKKFDPWEKERKQRRKARKERRKIQKKEAKKKQTSNLK